MARSTFMNALLCSFIAFIIGTVLISFIAAKKSFQISTPSVIDPKEFICPLRMTGFSSVNYEEGMIKSKISAAVLEIKPRKFFIFNVKAFNEIIIEDSDIEMYFHSNDADNLVPPDNLAKEKSSSNPEAPLESIIFQTKGTDAVIKGTGIITRGIIKNLGIKIFEGDRLVLKVKAEHANVDFKRSIVKLEDAQIRDIASNRTIKSKLILWKEKEKQFVIPGHYIELSDQGHRVGRNMKISI